MKFPELMRSSKTHYTVFISQLKNHENHMLGDTVTPNVFFLSVTSSHPIYPRKTCAGDILLPA